MVSDYELSQTMISRAETADAAGDREIARACFAVAAELQLAMVSRLPGDRPRTRSVYTASAVVLLCKAGDYPRAGVVAAETLSQPWLLPEGAAKIRTALANIGRPDRAA